MTDHDVHLIEEVARLIRPDSRLLFVTGAGLSADSGLPTYRGVGGIYGDRRTRHGCTIEEALSGTMLRTRPEITWEGLHELAAAGKGAKPNRGHEVIAELERFCGSVWVLTQNVDGLHRVAGSRNVIDIHGDLRHLVCTKKTCDYNQIVSNYEDLPALPTCPKCGTVARPDVVLFGEMLPMDKVLTLHREQDKGFDIVFSVGTSSLFPYIIEPVVRALDEGRATVEINPGETDLSRDVAYRIRCGAAEALGRLAVALRAAQ